MNVCLFWNNSGAPGEILGMGRGMGIHIAFRRIKKILWDKILLMVGCKGWHVKVSVNYRCVESIVFGIGDTVVTYLMPFKFRHHRHGGWQEAWVKVRKNSQDWNSNIPSKVFRPRTESMILKVAFKKNAIVFLTEIQYSLFFT